MFAFCTPQDSVCFGTDALTGAPICRFTPVKVDKSCCFAFANSVSARSPASFATFNCFNFEMNSESEGLFSDMERLSPTDDASPTFSGGGGCFGGCGFPQYAGCDQCRPEASGNKKNNY